MARDRTVLLHNGYCSVRGSLRPRQLEHERLVRTAREQKR